MTLKRIEEIDPDELASMMGFFNRNFGKHWCKLKYGVAVTFTSSGGLSGGNEMALLALIGTILNFGMMTFWVPDYVSPGVTLHYGAIALGKPDVVALKACKLLGKRLVEHVKVVKAGIKDLEQNDINL